MMDGIICSSQCIYQIWFKYLTFPPNKSTAI